MRVWIDLNTPKQVRFFGRLIDILKAKGHEVLQTSRKYREVEQLLKAKGMDAIVVGEYGGADLAGKLQASLKRALRLLKVVKDWRPDIAISFSSPEAARVAYGLAIPHYCVNDSPHSEAVAKLTIPLSAKLFTPKCIPIEKWSKLGARSEDIVQYNAVDPAAWLKDQDLTSKTRRRKKLVVIRTEEIYASYLLNKEERRMMVEKVARGLKEQLGEEIDIVVLARYPEQVKELRSKLKGVAFVPIKVIDTLKLFPQTSLFIGGGGTMTWEAALMGVPSISCTPVDDIDVEKYMVKLGLIRKARSSEEALEEGLKVLGNLRIERKAQEKRARKALASMEDPVEVIAKHIEEAS